MRSVMLAILLGCVVMAQSGSLQFTAPPTWKSRAAVSTMRVAEFVVPKVQGDPEDAEVIVYFFGGTGGSVEANIERWIGQFKTDAAPVRDSLVVGKLKVSAVDVRGTYVAEMKPGAAERFNKPDFRMRAAVVETPRGPYFIKFTGPARTVAAALPAFDQFIKSLRFQ